MKQDLNKTLSQTTRNKALILNQDKAFYGSFAEIGAGQEVARHFFQAGLASQTVAKSMSAYDKVFSDSIYGKGSRFVSQERLTKMLDHEFKLLEERLSERAKTSTFFAFANTVATSSHEDNPSCHGWMGVRFQTKPGGKPNDVILHVRMRDRMRLQQQEALGILGVNLLYAVHAYLSNGHEFIRSLMDNLSNDRIEVEFIHFSGPDVKDLDNRLLTLELVAQNFTRAVMFAPDGSPMCPSDALYAKPIIVQRGTFRPVTTTNQTILEKGLNQFKKDFNLKTNTIVSFYEISTSSLEQNTNLDFNDLLERILTIGAIGGHTLVSNFSLYADLKEHLRRLTTEPVAIVMGAYTLEKIFDEKYYREKKFGFMGAMAQLLDERTRLYIYPYHRDKGCMTTKTFHPGKKISGLYQHCLNLGQILDIENCDDVDTTLNSETVRRLLAEGDKKWESLVPETARELIKKKKYFKN
jgi:hypothetical protein